MAIIKYLLHRLSPKPGTIFLIDAAGAFFSLICLILLWFLPFDTGLSGPTMVILIIFAAVLGFADLIYYRSNRSCARLCLKAAILGNLAYIGVTFCFVLCQYNVLHPAVASYFGAEILVVGLLVYIEWKMLQAKNLPWSQ